VHAAERDEVHVTAGPGGARKAAVDWGKGPCYADRPFMLDVFRQKGITNVIYGVIIVATIFAFVVTFRPQAQSKTASLSEACVARVRGRCIDPKDFNAAYRVLMPSKSQALSRRLNLKRVALDGLIERELLDDEARRLGISVTDKEVTDQLYDGFVRVSIPAADPRQAQTILQEMYQSYGRAGILSGEQLQQKLNARDTAIPVDFRDPKTKLFDMKVYERQVRQLSNRSTTEFREEQARELLASKVRDVVRDPIRVSEAEAWDEYQQQHTTATLTYVPVKESWAARWTVDVAQADVDAWLKDHQADFDRELDERKKNDEPKAGHVRHILVKLPYGATDDEKATALAKLSWAMARVKSGEPFAEVARDVSDDSASAAMGGDVADNAAALGASFKAAADALKPGEITAGAVETQRGYHVIMRDDPNQTAAVDDALKKSLGRALVAKAKATDAAQAIAARLATAMRTGTSAEDAIKNVVSGYVKPTKLDVLKVLPGVSEASDAGAAADATTATGDKDKAAKPSPALPAKSFDASTDGDRPQVQTSGTFNRGGDPFAGLSPDGTTKVIAFAFEAKDGDTLDAPVRSTDAWNVVALKQRTNTTHEDFDKDRATVEDQMLRLKRDEALSLYVKRLRDQAKDDIKVDEAWVQEARADGGASSDPDDEDQY
jgi:peptidyl-prolyl cis-trans isomerase D